MLSLRCILAIALAIQNCLGGTVADFERLPVVEMVLKSQRSHGAQQRLGRQDDLFAGGSPKSSKLPRTGFNATGRRSFQLIPDAQSFQNVKGRGDDDPGMLACKPEEIKVVLIGPAKLIDAYAEVATLYESGVLKRHVLEEGETCVEAGFTSLLFTSQGAGLQFKAVTPSSTSQPRGTFMTATVHLPKFKID